MAGTITSARSGLNFRMFILSSIEWRSISSFISEILKNLIPNFKSYNNILQENIEIDDKIQNLTKSENIIVQEKGFLII